MGEYQHPLTFGVVIAQHQYTWPELVSQWKLAEELGFDSIWLFDHFMALYADPDGPCLETSTLLAALAQETKQTLQPQLPAAASVANPIDVLGDAPASRYAIAIEAALNDPTVNAVLVVLTPQTSIQNAASAYVLRSSQPPSSCVTERTGNVADASPRIVVHDCKWNVRAKTSGSGPAARLGSSCL